MYANDKETEKEIRGMTPVTIASNNIKYLGVTLNKQVKDLYNKNFKCLNKFSAVPTSSGLFSLSLLSGSVYIVLYSGF